MDLGGAVRKGRLARIEFDLDNESFVYLSLPSNTTMANKEMAFCTIIVNGNLRNAKVYPQSIP